MKVLITGAKGFVGKNLCETLKCIRDGKDRRERYRALLPLTIYEYDKESTLGELDAWCSEADFVFNLAGVNRPKKDTEFMKGNFDFAERLLGLLESHKNACPVMLASSAQACLDGPYAGSEYGKSKLKGEDLFRNYSKCTGAKTLIYRFPNVYGKWCRPNYNSVVATFCSNIANGLPIRVDDSSIKLELLYIDDLVKEMLEALLGNENRIIVNGNDYCTVEPTCNITLGDLSELIKEFRAAFENAVIPDVTPDSFSKKLLSTYLSYLPPDSLSHKPKMNIDVRGSFTEILHTVDRGQVSVNVTRPGVAKGHHWHHTKWEKFCVVSGNGLIQQRKIGTSREGCRYPVIECRVSGSEIEIVDMIPGYTHSIINLSETQDLVTIMWCNESFNPEQPDTYHEKI